MRITRFKFFIKGDSEKKMKLVVEKLKELNIGHIQVYSGDLRKETTVRFEADGGGTIANTKMGGFIGIVKRSVTHGEYVSELKVLKKKEKKL